MEMVKAKKKLAKMKKPKCQMNILKKQKVRDLYILKNYGYHWAILENVTQLTLRQGRKMYVYPSVIKLATPLHSINRCTNCSHHLYLKR